MMLSIRRQRWIGGVIPIGCALLSALVLAALSHLWVPYGGASSRWALCELPLIVCLTFLALPSPVLTLRRPLWWTMPIPAVLVWLLYVGFDVFMRQFARPPRVVDVYDLPTLWQSNPEMVGALAVGPLLLAVWCVAGEIVQGRRDGWRRELIGLGLKGALAGLAAALVGAPAFVPFARAHLGFTDISEEKSVRKAGRISYFIARERMRQASAAVDLQPGRLLAALARAVPAQPWNRPASRRRNLHLLVLESWIDPRRLMGIHCTPDPLAPELAALLPAAGFSTVISPVYGGHTAQAEFELITGAPALERFDSIEFSSLRGRQCPGFISSLAAQGWSTCATISTSVVIFNSRNAYPSLGFAALHALDYHAYVQPGVGERFLHDADLLQANLTMFAGDDHARPRVNYVLGVYGHVPYELATQSTHPEINVTPAGTVIDRIAVQFRERTAALAAWIAAIERNDPEAVILAIADHLPAVLDPTLRYQGGDPHRNIAVLRCARQPLDCSGLRYWQIPQVLWSLLQGDEAAAVATISAIQAGTWASPYVPEDLYFAVIGAGAGLIDWLPPVTVTGSNSAIPEVH